jgi:dihydroflavonol-4-reductase
MARVGGPGDADLLTVKVLLTGGAGFIGGAVTRALRSRGDDVVALVRDRERAKALRELGAELVEDDLSDVDRLTQALDGADAVIHAAGIYRIGITKAERGAMWDANVGTTTRLLDAAEAAKTSRFVYLSTVNVFGNTHGLIVDETYRRDLGEGFLSWYDETKYGAHEIAEQRIAAGAPVLIAMPGTVIGPGDHSQAGAQLKQAHDGTLPYIGMAHVGMTPIHVDDGAAGIVAVLDRGEIGRSYVVAGDCVRLIDALTIAAAVGGKRLPRVRFPDRFLRLMAPLGRLIGEPNAREIASASAGVTYWASSQRAKDELGFAPRDAEAAIRDTFAGP